MFFLPGRKGSFPSRCTTTMTDYQQLQKLSISFILNEPSASPMEEDSPEWDDDSETGSRHSQPAPTPPPTTSWQACSPTQTFFPPQPSNPFSQQQPPTPGTQEDPEAIPHRRSTYPLFEPSPSIQSPYHNSDAMCTGTENDGDDANNTYNAPGALYFLFQSSTSP